MAGLFTRIPDHFRLLDPGAGVGSLAAAVCEQVLPLSSPRHIEIVLYENDATLLPLLEGNMRHCRAALTAAGHELRYTIHDADFILTTQGRQAQRLLFDDNGVEEFDAVIMNPPYFKIGADSAQALAMADVFQGQTNIYMLFMARAAELLRPNGELVAITPRSFCNGLYFRDFRRSFFDRMSLDRIHLFESRTGNFRDVLQESLITVSHRGEQKSSVVISTSHGPELARPATRELPLLLILDKSSVDQVLKIPASTEDSQIMATVESWPHHFEDL